MSYGLKRESSPPQTVVKRPKLEGPVPLKLRSESPPGLSYRPSKPPSRGVERVPLPLQYRAGTPRYEEQLALLVSRAKARLALQGRRVVGGIKIFDDGIALDWIRDNSILDSVLKDSNENQNHTFKVADVKNKGELDGYKRHIPSPGESDEHPNHGLASICLSGHNDLPLCAEGKDVQDSDNGIPLLLVQRLPITYPLNDADVVATVDFTDVSTVAIAATDLQSRNSPLSIAGPSSRSVLVSQGAPPELTSTQRRAIFDAELDMYGSLGKSLEDTDSDDQGSDGEGYNDAHAAASHVTSGTGDGAPSKSSSNAIATRIPVISSTKVPFTFDSSSRLNSEEDRWRSNSEIARFPQTAGFGAVQSVTVPKAAHGRARRILVPSSAELPVATVSMRGDAQFIDRSMFARIPSWSLPHEGVLRHVEDACVSADVLVIGYNDGPCQISLIPLGLEDRRPPRRVDVSDRTNSTTLTRGDGPGRQGYTTQIKQIPLYHGSAVHALAHRIHCEQLISAAGLKILTVYLGKPCNQDAVRVSNAVRQIHSHPQDANLILLEVDHLDSQVQIFDLRRGSFNRAPCVQFGFRGSNSASGTRYQRGSCNMSLFVRGYADGAVKIWDYRKPTAVLLEREHLCIDPIIHTVFSGMHVLAYGGCTVTSLGI